MNVSKLVCLQLSVISISNKTRIKGLSVINQQDYYTRDIILAEKGSIINVLGALLYNFFCLYYTIKCSKLISSSMPIIST